MQYQKNIIFSKNGLIALSGLSLIPTANGLSQKIKFSEKPNIVLIAIDDLNNMVGSWGGQAITPNIDKLAAEGRQFLNAYCVVPASNPSRAAMFTGLRPETTGQFQNEGNFRDLPGGANLVTIPQLLSANGYTTVAAGKLFHHHRGNAADPSPFSDDISWDYQWKGNVGTPGMNLFLNENGFAKWHEGAENEFIKGAYKNSGMSYILRNGVWGAIPHPKEDCGDWQLTKFGAEFVQKEHDKPFFLGLGIFRPHSPQIAPQEFIDMYPLDKIKLPELPENDMQDVPEIGQTNWSSPFVKLVKEKGQLAKAVQGYLASISFADACVGQFMDALNKSKFKHNTIVILVTDHGFQLGHKNRWEKFSLWKQGTNVPMIVRLPEGMIKPGATNTAVSMLDIYPTIVDLIGIKAPAKLEGTSLMPLLKNKDAKRKQAAVVTWEKGSHSILRDGWNYIHYKDGSEELYNQLEDPNEYTNIATNPRYAKLKTSMKKFIPKSNLK